MAQDGNLANIRQKFRDLTGLASTAQMADATIDDIINDYYQNRFPDDVSEDIFRAWLTQTLSATDDGIYIVAADVLTINKPVKIDGTEVVFTMDHDKFFAEFPGDFTGSFIISDAGAGLAIGTASKSAVQNANQFFYDVGGNRYNEAAATETELSGDTVPQSKYGAWRLEINADGTVSIQAADNNSTGYATPALAVKGLIDESSTKAALGYVTAINTSGTFIPGATELDAAGVTATFTDGWSSNRRIPTWVLLYDNLLYVGLKSDDWRELKAPYIRKPTAMTGDSGTPEDVRWWLAIAYGAAIQQLGDDQDEEGARILVLTFDRLLKKINSKYMKQKNVGRVPQASF